ncbi:MAG: DUF6553 family protein [Tessaracoccus sp.]
MSEFPELETYRRGPKGDIDRFLGFWIDLIVVGKQAQSRGTVKRARRAVKDLVSVRPVRAALEGGGEEALADGLRDAAKVYFETCQTDSQYGAILFGTKRMNGTQIMNKAAGETAGAIAVLANSGALEGFATRLPRVLVDGYLGAFTAEDAAAALRAAVARSESASSVAELLW